MPISHMVKDAEGNYPGPQNAPEDYKVNLQHMNDYDYHGRFTRDKVLRAVQLIRDQEAEDCWSQLKDSVPTTLTLYTIQFS